MTSDPVHQVTVDLGARSYEIDISANALATAGERIAPLLKRPFTVIVTDEHVAGLHLAALQDSLAAAGVRSESIVLPASESSKRFSILESLLEDLLGHGVERRDTVIAFGGGVIGDLTGFAASILRRGCDFIQIPTTLLAQVDSSVGGKTAINSAKGKNLIGAFHQPILVLADLSVLSTLPPRELRAGYAEVAKYGLINDPEFFAWLEDNAQRLFDGDMAARAYAVEKSCQAKAAIVAEDEQERGARALLNLGHTFGHALEAETGYSDRLLHGEGVAIGITLAFAYSATIGLAAPEDAERVRAHFDGLGLPTKISQIEGPRPAASALLHHMFQDKKVVDEKLTLILARGIGRAFVQPNADAPSVLAFLEEAVAQ